MLTQRLWLKIMLFAICLGAAAGVLAVLTGAYEVLSRTMGSCFLVAVAAVLMIPMRRLIEKESAQLAGIFGSVVVITLLVLSLILTWDITSLFQLLTGLPHYRLQEAVFVLILWISLTGFPAIFFLRLTQTDHSRHAGWAGVILCGLVLFLLTISTVNTTFRFTTGGMRYYDHAFAVTGGWLGLCGLLAVAAFIGRKSITDGPWRWIGVVTAAGAWLIVTYGVWGQAEPEIGQKVFVVLLSIAGYIAYLNLLLLCPLASKLRWLLLSTVSLTAFALILLNLLMIVDIPLDHDSFAVRLAAAAIILATAFTLVFLLTSRMTRPMPTIHNRELRHEVTLTCPLCKTKQALPTGRPCACRSCGLGIEIRIAEPQCPACGYTLYHITAATCPECGHTIRHENGQSSSPPAADPS